MTPDTVPGIVVHHVPAATRNYIGCPSIVVLPDGNYIASHSYFGDGSTNSKSFVYRSEDRGSTWVRIADIRGQIWSKLFLHNNSIYIIGTDHCDRYDGRLNGKMVIRRSDDDGRSWTDATGPDCGLLSDEDGYHTAPTPLVVHDGRIWKGFEYACDPDRGTWRAFVISATVNSDLLDRSSWTFSEHISSWKEHQWIEGNMVVTPDGQLVDILRTNFTGSKRCGDQPADEPAAIVRVSQDGTTLRHDPEKDTIRFPGGGTKFTVKFDSLSSKYYTLINPQNATKRYRNVLSLSTSEDLIHWSITRELIRHPDPLYHAFQYVDWDFDGNDIVYVSRTAYDDGLGGAHRAHDANYLTFDRVVNFRE
jgi:hypothetical protein